MDSIHCLTYLFLRYMCFVFTLADATDTSLVSYIQSFHTSEFSLSPTSLDLRRSTVS